MTQRIIETEGDLKLLMNFIGRQDLPFTVNIKQGGRRSIEQNRLVHLWMAEIAEQLPGTFDSAEHVRGYCKLHFGVAILKHADETFREHYDRSLRPLPYETKLACMMEPIALPVTSRMNVKQLSAYLDAVHRHFSEQGVVLTIPQEKDPAWRPAPPIEAYEGRT